MTNQNQAGTKLCGRFVLIDPVRSLAAPRKPAVERYGPADLDALLAAPDPRPVPKWEWPLDSLPADEKERNALTEFMAAPYVDEVFGAMDPDELRNVNLEEFSKYVCCLHDESPKEFEHLKPVLRAWLERLLADPLRNGDEIVIPTGSMFIELLPFDRSRLEDFRLKHREWDVYKVQAEVCRMELENVRYAARLRNVEMEDPDIEKRIVFTGNGLQPSINVDNS